MENPHGRRLELDGVVEEICHGLQCLVGTHAAHVYLSLEVKLAAAGVLAGSGADGGHGGLFLRRFDTGERVEGHSGAQSAEGHFGLLAAYGQDAPGDVGRGDADVVADGEWRLVVTHSPCVR